MQNGASPLFMASQNGHVEVVDKLLKCGARVDLQRKVRWNVASLVAACFPHDMYIYHD